MLLTEANSLPLFYCLVNCSIGNKLHIYDRAAREDSDIVVMQGIVARTETASKRRPVSEQAPTSKGRIKV